MNEGDLRYWEAAAESGCEATPSDIREFVATIRSLKSRVQDKEEEVIHWKAKHHGAEAGITMLNEQNTRLLNFVRLVHENDELILHSLACGRYYARLNTETREYVDAPCQCEQENIMAGLDAIRDLLG